MDIQQLIDKSHSQAVKSGWWPDGPEKRPVCDIVNCLHSEISEAWEEYRAGRMETWYSIDGQQIELDVQGESVLRQTGRTAKPEGFYVEIADLCIRLADSMGAYGWHSKDVDTVYSLSPVDLVSRLHKAVAAMSWQPNEWVWSNETESVQSADETARFILGVCIGSATSSGVDLLSLCELKMAYNATREHRHGGKLA